MRKSIKNYTTSISVQKTLSEIQELLVKAGANKLMFDFEDGEASGVMFLLKVGDKELPIKLPARVKNVEQIFYVNKNVKNRYYKKDLTDSEKQQSKRTAWRNIKDWIDAQLALVETEMVKFEEVFLPYVVMGNKTIFEQFEDNQLKLESGE